MQEYRYIIRIKIKKSNNVIQSASDLTDWDGLMKYGGAAIAS